MLRLWAIRTIAVNQLIGCIAQLVSIEWTVSGANETTSLGSVIIMLAIYISGAIFGALLLADRNLGYAGTIFVQAAQLVVVVSNSIIFKFMLGIGVLLGVNHTGAISSPIVQFGYESSLYLRNVVEEPAIYVNVVGAIAVALIFREWRGHKK